MEQQELELANEEYLDKVYEDFIKHLESRQTDIQAPIAFVHKQADSLRRDNIEINVVITFFDNKLTYLYHYWKSRYEYSEDGRAAFDLRETITELEKRLDFNVQGKVLHIELETVYNGKYSSAESRDMLIDLLRMFRKHESDLMEIVDDKEILLTVVPYFDHDYSLVRRLGFKDVLIDSVLVKRLKSTK